MADLNQVYEDAGTKYNIDPLLLRSMAQVESGERTRDGKGNLITSGAGAKGIMQFTDDTARQYNVDVTDASSSITGAAHYMSDLLEHMHGDVPGALALYNGSLGDQSQKYAKQILSKYQALQANKQDALRKSGVTSEAQPTPSVIEITASGKPPAPPQPDGAGRTAANDFESVLSGKGSAGTPPASVQSPANDFSGVFSPAPAAAPPPATAPAATIPAPLQAPPATVTPPQPNWLERNVSAPVHAMMDPAAPAPPQNNLLGMPLLQEAGAGIVQGTRDVAQTLRNFGDYADSRVPALAALDHYVRSDEAPALLRTIVGSPETTTLPAQTEAFQKQYGSDIPAQTARIGSEMLTTYPVGLAAKGAGALARAAPYAGKLLALAVEGAAGGALQNAAVSAGNGQDPLRAAEEGAAGGAVVGGILGMLGRIFARVGHPGDAAIADRLGIRLSTGQRAGSGSVARRLEDTTAIIPGSGAARFADEQRQGITRVIAREAGIAGPVEHIDTAMLNAAEDKAGNLIENSARRITVPGTPLMRDLAHIENLAHQGGPATQEAYSFRALRDELLNRMAAGGGDLSGPEFQRFITKGSRLDRALHSGDQGVRQMAQEVREALFNAASSGSGAAQDAIKDLTRGRYQWKVIQTVRPAIAKTAAGTDEMSLPALAQAIRNEFNMRMTGAGANMQDLSRMLSGPLRALASSGTAERSLWQKLFGFGGTVGGPGGAGVLGALGHPQAAEAVLAATAIPAAASIAAGRASRFGPGLGIDAFEAARQGLNPLAARLFGPRVGRNMLESSP